MTSAPVKNAGPLPNYINTGNAVPSKTCGTDSNFGSAMNKATTGNRNLYETRQLQRRVPEQRMLRKCRRTPQTAVRFPM